MSERHRFSGPHSSLECPPRQDTLSDSRWGLMRKREGEAPIWTRSGVAGADLCEAGTVPGLSRSRSTASVVGACFRQSRHGATSAALREELRRPGMLAARNSERPWMGSRAEVGTRATGGDERDVASGAEPCEEGLFEGLGPLPSTCRGVGHKRQHKMRLWKEIGSDTNPSRGAEFASRIARTVWGVRCCARHRAW